MTGRAAAALLLAGGLAACASPEATRDRAGGPGADVGNRGRPVEFHGGAVMFYGTPCVMAVKCDGPRPAFGKTTTPG
jgi:hypothetical protein